MVFKEIKVNTRRELLTLFEKLDKNGFTWATGRNLIANINIVDNMPAYIHLHKGNRVSWGAASIPSDLWGLMI